MRFLRRYLDEKEPTLKHFTRIVRELDLRRPLERSPRDASLCSRDARRLISHRQ